jgi:hypothetical protein
MISPFGQCLKAFVQKRYSHILGKNNITQCIPLSTKTRSDDKAIITVWWTPHWLPVIHPSKIPIYRNNQDKNSRNLGIKRLKLKNQKIISMYRNAFICMPTPGIERGPTEWQVKTFPRRHNDTHYKSWN